LRYEGINTRVLSTRSLNIPSGRRNVKEYRRLPYPRV